VRITTWAAVAAAALLLAGCGSGDDATSAGSTGTGRPAADAVLGTADSPLGRIVVDAEGRTVYVFDEDTAGSGRSACTGDCLRAWPAVPTGSAAPEGDGVTGELGTITRDDGSVQVTLAGLPLYSYAGDSHPGDVTGQGAQGVWWVVAPDGSKITAAPSSAVPPPVPGY